VDFKTIFFYPVRVLKGTAKEDSKISAHVEKIVYLFFWYFLHRSLLGSSV
jgi:hypothetical protein